MSKIHVLSHEVGITRFNEFDFICITDIAKFRNATSADDLIRNWLRNRNTIEFLGIWEQIYNPEFKPVEFDGFKRQAGLNSFVLTPKQWIERTGAIGIVSKQGRYGGTFAHKDIAYELKQLGWDIRRNLAKINYRIHTDAIQEHLIPAELGKNQTNVVYATEAEVLIALDGVRRALIAYWNEGL